MSKLLVLFTILQVIALVQSIRQVRQEPLSFSFSTLSVLSANGSSLVGKCSSVTQNLDRTSTCNTPSSSVLFDGHTPTLTGLDGDTWANELMILYYDQLFGYYDSFKMTFNFSSSSTVARVEVTVFNCPEWRSSLNILRVQHFTTSYQTIATAYLTALSCTSLIKMCVSFPPTNRKIRIDFDSLGLRNVPIAEVAFYSQSTPCPLSTIIPGATLPPAASDDEDNVKMTTQNFMSTYNYMSKHPSTTTTTEKPNLSNSDEMDFKESPLLMSLLGAIIFIMALLTTLVSIVVAYKFCIKKSRGSAQPEALVGKVRKADVPVYETIAAQNLCENLDVVQLKANSAYAV